MRVSQVHTLVWVGNVLLVAATGWVGFQFWQAKKDQTKTPAVEWPTADKATRTGSKWPGELARFQHIWTTPLNGLVPPPPVKADEVKREKADPVVELKKKLKVLGTWVGEPTGDGTIVHCEWSGKPISMGLGYVIDDTVEGKPFRWQLQRVAIRKADTSALLRFFSSQYEKNDGLVDIEPPVQSSPDFAVQGTVLFRPEYSGPVQGDTVDKNLIAEQAYRDPETGDWIVPANEVNWWRVHGETLVFDKLKTQDLTAPDGTKLGLKLMSHPGETTPVGTDRGVGKGDIIKSINGTPVGSRADVLLYLRGPGKDAPKYVVVVERDGAERTLTYRTARRSRA